MTHYLDAAVEAARAAGEMLRHSFRQPLRVNSSEAHDIKLEIDVRAQTLITEMLLEQFPEHALYGEEGIVTADCDLRVGLHVKRLFDAAGHYGREDVLLPLLAVALPEGAPSSEAAP